MRIVAFGQRSRVGKDTAATMLVSMLRLSNRYPGGVVKVSFARALKFNAWLLWGQHGLKDGDFYETEAGASMRDVPLPGINKTPVELWIALGNAVRTIHPDTWIECAFNVKADAVVISDLRFPNEEEFIHALGGKCIEVWRSTGITKGSDANSIKYDHVICNDGTLNDLHAAVETIARIEGLL